MCVAVAEPASAAGLESLSNHQATTGLKDALIQGAGKAVSTLGARDGFLGNDSVKIPLPPAIEEGRVRSQAHGHEQAGG